MQVRDIRTGDWLWTQKTILYSPHISATDFKVYCGLASYAGNEDQRSFPGVRTLATQLNLSKSSIIRSLQSLERCRVISVDRVRGESNVYYLLNVDKVDLGPLTKKQSDHHSFIDYYTKTVSSIRGIKVQYSPKDFGQLKRIQQGGYLSGEQLEQLALYYLASPRFKTFSPSLSVFLSAGVLNALHNTLNNDANFYKELESYRMGHHLETMVLDRKLPEALSEQLKKLKIKMTA